jgi:hypothetical protein
MATTFTLIDHPQYLTPADPADDATRRIMGVMPFIVKLAKGWLRRLPAFHRAQFDLEDVLQELWAELLHKSRYYDPARAAFTTFTAMVVGQHLQDIGDRLCRGPHQDSLDRDVIDPAYDSALDVAEARESARMAREAVQEAMGRIESDIDFLILAWNHGVAGRAPKPVAEQAALLLMTTGGVIHRRNLAEQQLKTLLAG